MRNFADVEEPYECVMLLDKMNLLIDTLWQLSDSRYYLEYIFNRGSIVEEYLKKNGFDDEYFATLAGKFEELRSVSFGDCIDWQGLVDYEFRIVATSERIQNKQNEEEIRKLEYKIRQLEEGRNNEQSKMLPQL